MMKEMKINEYLSDTQSDFDEHNSVASDNLEQYADAWKANMKKYNKIKTKRARDASVPKVNNQKSRYLDLNNSAAAIKKRNQLSYDASVLKVNQSVKCSFHDFNSMAGPRDDRNRSQLTNIERMNLELDNGADSRKLLDLYERKRMH